GCRCPAWAWATAGARGIWSRGSCAASGNDSKRGRLRPFRSGRALSGLEAMRGSEVDCPPARVIQAAVERRDAVARQVQAPLPDPEPDIEAPCSAASVLV